MNIKKKNNFPFNKYLPSFSTIIRLFLVFTSFINVLLSANLVLLERLFLFSVLLSIIYILFTGLWKKEELYIYFFLLFLTVWVGPSFAFIFFNIMSIIFLLLILFHSEHKTVYTNIIILNIFLLTMSFLMVKYWLLYEFISRTDLDFNTSKISISIFFLTKNSLIYLINATFMVHPGNSIRIFLCDIVWLAVTEYLNTDLPNFPYETLAYLYWLCFIRDYFLPSVGIALILH